MHHIVKHLLAGIIDLLYPPFCRLCNAKLTQDEQVVCVLCWAKLDPTNLGNWVDKVTHNTCLDCAFSGWFFNDTFQKIIHSLKYSEKHAVAEELAIHLAKMFSDEITKMNLNIITPVPLHQAKFRHRGFNQSDLIAKPLANEFGIPYNPELLNRGKNTASQTTLSLEERKMNVLNAFSVEELRGNTRVLIVDDVLTSGATVSSCAQALRNCGAKFIAVLTAGTPYFET